MTAELDITGFNKAMAGLHDALIGDGRNGDAQTLLIDEAVRLNKQFLNFTPPLGPGGRAAGAEQAGKKAIERELKSLFSEASTNMLEDITRRKGSTNVDTWETGRDGQKIHLQWANVDTTGTGMRALHKKYRGYRGKVPLTKQTTGNWKSRAVVPTGTRAEYIRVVQAQVGKWKASISGLLAHLGKHLPAYVSKHLGNVASLQILDVSKLNDPQQPSVMFGSRFPGIGNPQYRYKERMADALRARQRAMVSRARLILSGYAKDVSAGIRTQRRAAQTATEPEPVIE